MLPNVHGRVAHPVTPLDHLSLSLSRRLCARPVLLNGLMSREKHAAKTRSGDISNTMPAVEPLCCAQRGANETMVLLLLRGGRG